MPDILLVIALFKSQSDILFSNMLRTLLFLIGRTRLHILSFHTFVKGGLLPGSGSSEESEKRLNTLKHSHNISEGQ